MISSTLSGNLSIGQPGLFIPPNNRVCCTLEMDSDPVLFFLMRPLGFLLWFDPQGRNQTLAIGDSGLLQHDFSVDLSVHDGMMLSLDKLIDRGLIWAYTKNQIDDPDMAVKELIVRCDADIEKYLEKPVKHGQEYLSVTQSQNSYDLGEIPNIGMFR